MTTISELHIEDDIVSRGLTAPRLTPEYIDKCIVEETFHLLEGTGKPLMICVLKLKNGFKITGESTAASIENFNPEIGKKVSRDKARAKIWELEGYLLQEMLSDRPSFFWKDEFIAKLCYEVNRAYAQSLGDTTQPPWEEASDDQKSSAMSVVDLHKKLPEATVSASHHTWLAGRLAEGWTYGPVLDEVNKKHPGMVHFNTLPQEQKSKDFIFKAIINLMTVR